MATSRRSNRVRFKPLEHWNNEKLYYDLHGDLQYVKRIVDGPTISPRDLFHETVLNQELVNLSVMPLKMSRKKHEVSILKVVPQFKQSKSKGNSLSQSTIESDNETVISKCTISSISQMSIVKTNFKTFTSTIDESYIENNILKHKTYAKYKKSNRLVPNLSERNSDIPVHSDNTEKINSKTFNSNEACSEDNVYNWKLSNMHMVENCLNEKYFVQRGPDIPRSKMKYGFIFLVSETLHWSDSSEIKEIYVIEGSGKLSVENGNKKKEVDLTKGLTMSVKKGKILLKKSDDVDILKLFIVYY